MSKQLIDCIFYKGSKSNLKKRIEKYSETVDRFIIFYKEEVDVDIFTATTKPIELILVEKELYIEELIEFIKKQEYDFEDIISISIANEFYDIEILDRVKSLLPFGCVIIEKYIFDSDADPIEYRTSRGTVFFNFSHIKYLTLDVSKIWLSKQSYSEKDTTIISGGFQI